MKILIPTDFSETAEKAFDAAVLLAYKFDADIKILHCIDEPYFWNLTPEAEKLSNKIKEELFAQAEQKIKIFEDLLIEHNIDCTHVIKSGDFLDIIDDPDVISDIDLITMGSYGVRGKREWFIGSNTQKVIRKVEKNALIIKNPIDNIDFKKVVYVSGLFKDEQESFKRFLEFMSHFEIEELHILSINTLAFFSQPSVVMREALKDYREIANEYNVVTHFYGDFSVDAGVRHFCIENDIDLVAISNSEKNPVKRFFQGSNVEMIINHSDLPVLSIDY